MTNTRSRNYCFTWNNPPEDWDTKLKISGISYFIGQLEMGSCLHVQGYLELENNQRISWFKNRLPELHLESRRGTQKEAIEYCKKTDTQVSPPIEWGNKKTQGERTDIEAACLFLNEGKQMSEVAESMPATFVRHYKGLGQYKLLRTPAPQNLDYLPGIWFYGPPGTGKSRKAREDYPNAYDKLQNKWWDGYEGDRPALIDDFDRNGKCLGYHLKRWADRYSFNAETKGGTICIRPVWIIITSNYSPEQIFDDDSDMCDAIRRRFKVTHFN